MNKKLYALKLVDLNLNYFKKEAWLKLSDRLVMEKEIGLLGNENRFIVKLVNAFQIEVTYIYKF
jgi:hypothetical protein